MNAAQTKELLQDVLAGEVEPAKLKGRRFFAEFEHTAFNGRINDARLDDTMLILVLEPERENLMFTHTADEANDRVSCETHGNVTNFEIDMES